MTDMTTELVDQNTDLDSLGPIDYIVVEFPAGASNFTGEMAEELLALVDAGTIRVIDVLILTPRWIRAAPPASSSGRTCGPRRSLRQHGARVDS